MYNLWRYLNQNRKKVLLIILIVVFVFLFIQLLNWLTKTEIENKKAIIQNIEIENEETLNDVISDKSSITGKSIDSVKLREDTDIIKKFMEFCNNGNINEAYEMISTDCKESMFQTEKIFKETYFNNVFNGTKKIYTIENWLRSIYKINITEDILATGNTNNNETKQDYITINKENDIDKVNINGFIYKKDIEKNAEKNNIKIEVLSQEQYKDYTIFNIEVSNNNNYIILMDSLEDIDSMYIEDSNNIKYSAYSHELSKNQLLINAKSKTKIKVKYYCKYSSTKDIEKLVFSSIILNYDNDLNAINNNYLKINIEI